MRNLIKDLATLTTIEKKTFEKLLDKVVLCICDAIEESLFNKEDTSIIDVGIGKLIICYNESAIKYRFEPDTLLSSAIKETVETEQSPLTDVLDETLKTKMTDIYKSFF